MKKAILLGDYSAPRFHSLYGIDEVIQSIYDGVLSVEPSEDYEHLSVDFLKQYHVAILYTDNWDTRASVESTASLLTYVADGGSVLALHCGLTALRRHEMRLMMGARFEGHPSQVLLDFSPIDPPHPITAGIPSFQLTEEPYQFSFNVFTPRCDLLMYQYARESQPAAWCHRYGFGRVACFAPGHSQESFCPPVRTILYRMGLWLTGRL